MTLIYDRDFLSFELIKDGRTLIEGGHIQIVKFIIQNDIMDLCDFKLAVSEMEKNKHNVSEFGILGSFLFTFAG